MTRHRSGIVLFFRFLGWLNFLGGIVVVAVLSDNPLAMLGLLYGAVGCGACYAIAAVVEDVAAIRVALAPGNKASVRDAFAPEVVEGVQKMHAEGAGFRTIAREFGISKTEAHDIALGR